MIGEKDSPSPSWDALKRRGLLWAGDAVMAIVAAVVFVIISERDLRWFVGFTLLALVVFVFAMVKDKKLFLLCALFTSVIVRTTINLWLPEATRFSTGSGTTTSAVELFAFDPALFLLSLYLLFTRNKNDDAAFRGSDVAALLFVCFCTLSLVNSSYPNLTLVRLPVMVRMPLIYYCLSRGVTTRHDVNVLSLVIVGLVMVESGLAIVQTQVGSFSWMASLVERAEQTTTATVYGVEAARATGTIGYTTVFAQWLGVLSPMALAIVMFRRGKLQRLSAGVAYVAALVALVLSLSRAEWINIPIVFAIFFSIQLFKKTVRRWSSALTFAAILIALGVVVALRSDLILARLTAPDSDSAYIRIPMMAVASRMIADNPIFGVGLHNYTQVMRSYGIGALPLGWDFGVHNSFLYLWAETGVFNLLTILFLWFVTFRRLLFCLKWDNDLLWPTAAGMLGGLVALLLHSQVEEGFHIHQVLNATLWAYFGLAAAIKTITIRQYNVGAR